ncbi:hypothetical protein CP533_6841 [Ophiocordyceps camponoti-saundersi (nom. inval.)]|nr:hypothetical protein CP533_6841 [Ophiocordyceps camponoti-saundersi (nom. inval.)]
MSACSDGRGAWSRIRSLSSRRRSKSMPRSTSTTTPVAHLRLPDSAVSGTTIGGYRHIAISIPIEASPFAEGMRSQYPVFPTCDDALSLPLPRQPQQHQHRLNASLGSKPFDYIGALPTNLDSPLLLDDGSAPWNRADDETVVVVGTSNREIPPRRVGQSSSSQQLLSIDGLIRNGPMPPPKAPERGRREKTARQMGHHHHHKNDKDGDDGDVYVTYHRDHRMRDMERRLKRLERNGDVWLRSLLADVHHRSGPAKGRDSSLVKDGCSAAGMESVEMLMRELARTGGRDAL